MNKLFKNLIIGLCIVSIGHSVYADDGKKLLIQYNRINNRYIEKCNSTASILTTIATCCATAGAFAAATLGAHHYWNMDLFKAGMELGLPLAGTAFTLAQAGTFPIFRWLAKHLHTQHTIWGHQFPLSKWCLSFSNIRNLKKELNKQIKAKQKSKNPIDAVRMSEQQVVMASPFLTRKCDKLAEAKKLETDNDPLKHIPDVREIAGGYERAIYEIVLQLVAPERAKAIGKRMSRGILLYGPSGTGKSLKASQVAAMVQAAMKDVVVGELKDKWQGGSEEKISELFAGIEDRVAELKNLPADKKRELAQAQQIIAASISIKLQICDLKELVGRAQQEHRDNDAHDLEERYTELQRILDAFAVEQAHPTDNHQTVFNNFLLAANMDPAAEPKYHRWGIVFVDEIDSFGSRGNNNGSDVSNSMINQVLNEMDGSDKSRNKRTVVIGTTNRLELLDKALLRAGRFDKQLYMGIPETAAQRLAYLNFFGTTNAEPAKGRYRITTAVLPYLQEVANATDNFSQADLEGLFNQAADFEAVYNYPAIRQPQLKRALDLALEKRAIDKRNEIAQKIAQGVTKQQLNQDAQLECFRYYSNENNADGYRVNLDSVRPNLEQPELKEELLRSITFFTAKDIKDTFEGASYYAREAQRERILWRDIQRTISQIQLRKRVRGQLLLGIRAPQAHPAAAQPPAANAQLQQNAAVVH